MERNKHWRQQQRRKFYIAALKRYASWDSPTWIGDEFVEHPKWIDLYKAGELSVYKSVRVPCSCYLCRGERYDRRAFRMETQRILKESDEE
jgi:hypothetical protein